jgi:hypothetical protein
LFVILWFAHALHGSRVCGHVRNFGELHSCHVPIAEEWDLYLRLAEAGHQGDILPIEAQLYRRHASSTTFTTSRALRAETAERFVTRFAPSLPPAQLTSLLQLVTGFWKNGYEPSACAQLLAGRSQQIQEPSRRDQREVTAAVLRTAA